MGLDVLRWGGERLRAGPWRGDARVAYMSPHPSAPPPTVAAVRQSCALLAERGFVEVVTSALGAAETQGFLGAGFAVRERLHLLAHDMRAVPPVGPAPLRRGRRPDRAEALEVDGAAFDGFWRLDREGFDEAMTATPTARFRVAASGGVVRGYAITGRAGDRGFLQRLAVDPAWAGRGYGAALVADGLAWLVRRGATRTIVNTQEHNDRALALYERLGFRRQPGGLVVLHAALDL